jgi:hypothetical protein
VKVFKNPNPGIIERTIK